VDESKFLINAEQLQARIDDTGLRILDCRFVLSQPDAGRKSYLLGHIPGAVYADLDKDLAGPVGEGSGRHPLPGPADLELIFGRLGISADTDVVVYDDGSGALAARAWWLLQWMGHEQVALLDGGLKRWQALGMALDVGDVTVEVQRFSGSSRGDWTVEADEILLHVLAIEPLPLIDARDEARYRGEVEPIDKIAGHIPGAINVPFQRSLNSDGCWKTPTELRKLWADELGDAPKARLSVMCGSGVTACHLIISARLAGLPHPRLYVGSWSEWIEDPTRPIATGSPGKE